jgi:hypothetical protein
VGNSQLNTDKRYASNGTTYQEKTGINDDLMVDGEQATGVSLFFSKAGFCMTVPPKGTVYMAETRI